MCRATGVRCGLVTNGDLWTFVDAPLGEAAGTATWDAALWLEERLTLDAFTTLLGVRRFFGVAEPDQLEALLAESGLAEAEVTDQLGKQVRASVELLVDAWSRVNRERDRAVFADLTYEEIYEAAVTVLMRIVFLLFAEERGLFLLGDPEYDETYAVSTLRAALEEDAAEHGEDVLERRHDAWHRLLATFRMVYAGVQHENLRLPPYGGSLFDPDRFAFLEGRRADESWRDTPSTPLPVDDRTVFHLLDALQVLRFRDRRGVTEARRLSFRSLDVEQIGHVYEGLLDHGAVPVDDVALGFGGKLEPERALVLVEERAATGREQLVDWLVAETGLSKARVGKLLDAEIEPADNERLLSACENDRELAARLEPYVNLLRRDLRGLPQVYLPGGVYVTQSSERRSSGTYYTPKALAEEMVLHTLEPLVYSPGPAEGAEREDWKLRPSGEILDLRICDPAMGSGAFLVAATRYLSSRLLEAWEAEGKGDSSDVELAPGHVEQLPDDETDREIFAHRVIADRCIYGVDRNQMAVEMAKLSLWLVTLAKERPFSFLDHALRCGDSLLGITDLRQLEFLHLDPERGREIHQTLFDPAEVVRPLVKQALEKRRELESFSVVELRDSERKEALAEEAGSLLDRLKVVADVVVASALSTAAEASETYDDRLLAIAPEVVAGLALAISDGERTTRLADLRLRSEYWLDEGRPPMSPSRRCLHWPLEFPEVFVDSRTGRFDAAVGNPPFMGGKRLSSAFGSNYRELLTIGIGRGKRGNADLVAFFFLRSVQIATHFGLLATNTIAQGDTREVGLGQVLASGTKIFRAVKSTPWPGGAALAIAKVWATEAEWVGPADLDGNTVRAVDSMLEPTGRVTWAPVRLGENSDKCFQACILATDGFLLRSDEAEALLASDSRNADVVRPLLNGEELTTHPQHLAERWVIDFADWPQERCEQYLDPFRVLLERVRPAVEAKKSRYSGWIDRWWQFWNPRPRMRGAIRDLDRVIAIALTSKVVQPAMVDNDRVFSHAIGVFAFDDFAHFGLLTSAFHWLWALSRASTLETRIRYTPTDCFGTFPMAEEVGLIGVPGQKLHEHRAGLMADRWEGLTKTYNRVHDPGEQSADIVELRRLHIEVDEATASCYGWTDLDVERIFVETRHGMRYTLGPSCSAELLDRLLELNRERARLSPSDLTGPASAGSGTSARASGGKARRGGGEARESQMFSTDG